MQHLKVQGTEMLILIQNEISNIWMHLFYILMRSLQMHKQFRCPYINNIFLILFFFSLFQPLYILSTFVHLPSFLACISKKRILMN